MLTESAIARLMDASAAIRVVRQAFQWHARNQAAMPPKVYLSLPKGDFRAMPAYLSFPKACGIKWVNVHPQNPKRGLPSVMAMIVLNDPETGLPLAVIEGGLITKLRTAASAAVAAQVLARPDSAVAALVGCGAQARPQAEALMAVLPIRQVNVWGHKKGDAEWFCATMRHRWKKVSWQAFSQIKACVREADVVATLTPSRRPLIKRSWISSGTHINAVGADGPGKQELDWAILRHALVVVDDREQAIHGGELNVPVSRGQFSPRAIHASLGEILIGRRQGRQSVSDITVFDSTGLAIHDIALGWQVLNRARKKAVGRSLPWLR